MSSIQHQAEVVEVPLFDTERATDDAEYRNGLRHRCETDHFFLARVMGLKLPFSEEVHRPVANLYFPKNRNIPITEQHEIKRRMHLDPRDTWKTTFGRVDSLQWILAFPEEITLLNVTATQKLGEAISAGTTTVFWHRPKSQPTPLHVLYPELVVYREPFRNEDYWNSPQHHSLDIDKTVAFTSPYSTQSGWHPLVMNPDDMVDTKNSGIRATNDVRQGIISTYETNKNTLREGGYINMRGTRYHPFELYGKILEGLDLENPEESGWKVLIRSAVVLKNGERLDPGVFPGEDDMWLPFKALGLTYKVMRTKFLDDYESFACQQLNDPMGGSVPTFSDRLYDGCTITPERVPTHRDGDTYICWRMPYGLAKETSYLEGAAVRIVDGRVYIIDCWQGQYIPSRIAEKIVQEQKKHRAEGVMLLDTPGSDHIWQHIKNEAARKNITIPLQWSDWIDNDVVRADRIKQLEPMLKTGRIFFSTGMTKGVQCRKQFVNFGLVPETGIVECVAKLTEMVPLSQMRANLEDEEIEAQTRARERGHMASWMNLQGMQQVDEQAVRKVKAHAVAMNRATQFGFPPLPGGLDG